MKITDNNNLRIVSDTVAYPRPICLAECSASVVRGYEKDVLKTLKAFSSIDLMKSKNNHSLHKSGNLEEYFKKAKRFGSEKVYSLDVKNRNDTYRLFYCIDKMGV